MDVGALTFDVFGTAKTHLGRGEIATDGDKGYVLEFAHFFVETPGLIGTHGRVQGGNDAEDADFAVELAQRAVRSETLLE